MSNYIAPQNRIFQELRQIPVTSDRPRRALLIGGHAQIVRFGAADADLGLYSSGATTNYAWPGREPGSVVDQLFTQLKIENALLPYGSLGGSVVDRTIVESDEVVATVFGGTRHSTFGSRDLRVSDVVRVTGTPSGPGAPGGVISLWTTVSALLPSKIPSVISAPTTDVGNVANNASATVGTVTQSAGTTFTITLDSEAVETSGWIDYNRSSRIETLTIVVSTADVHPYATATVDITSSSGKYDALNVPVSNAAGVISVEVGGAVITLGTIVGTPDLELGMAWDVVLDIQYVAITVTAAGTYTKTSDVTYIVEVTKGGDTEAVGLLRPEVRVTTLSGTEQSGPTVLAAAEAVTIGSSGVTFTPSAGQILRGSKFYVSVTGVTNGPITQFRLTDSLHNSFEPSDVVSVSYHIVKNEVDLTNLPSDWSQDLLEFTVNAGITTTDPSWYDGADNLLPLPVVSVEGRNYSKLQLSYRAWLTDLASTAKFISTTDDLSLISGEVSADNPLKFAAMLALSNSDGTGIYVISAIPGDVNTWQTALENTSSTDGIRNIAPLTRDPEVLALVAANVNSLSGPTTQRWRSGWFNLEGFPRIPLVSNGSSVTGYGGSTTSDGNIAMATIVDDPATAEVSYTLVEVPASNSQFVTNNVRAGDRLRTFYSVDAAGNETYQEYVIDSVVNESRLLLLAGPSAPQAVATKIEVWRNLNTSERADEIVKSVSLYSSRRIVAVWPDVISIGGANHPGYFLTAALAAHASTLAPHESMTRKTLRGFSAIPSVSDFPDSDKDKLARGGVWVVTQSDRGEIFTRHALTTETTDLNTQEEAITRNLDDISYRFRDTFAPFVGVSNVTPSNTQIMRMSAEALLNQLGTFEITPQLGAQVLSFKILQFEPSVVFRDRYIVRIELTVPFANNGLDIYLTI